MINNFQALNAEALSGLLGFPSIDGVDPTVTVFTRTIGSSAAQDRNVWQTYTVPPKARMLYMFLLGGGGGGGKSSGGGGACGGGGGGGSGACSKFIVPTFVIPRKLFVLPGYGGDTLNAIVATQSIVAVGLGSIVGSINSLRIACSGLNGSPAQNGTFGSSVGGGPGGAGESAFTPATTQHSGLTLWSSVAGQAGAAGGAQTGAIGGSITPAASGLPCTGGAGGGGCTAAVNFAGGDISGVANSIIFPTIPGGAALTNGKDGILNLQPFFGLGGSGGGSDFNGSNAGLGGYGAFGCGGGGAGGGTSQAIKSGGEGLVIIMAW